MKLDYFRTTFLIMTILIVNSIAVSQIPDNKYTVFVKTLVESLKLDGKETKLKECLPTSWLNGTEENLAAEANKLLEIFISKFDKIYTSLDDKIDKPCEFKDKVKDLIKQNPPLTFIQIASNKLKRAKSNKKHSKQFQPFEDILKNHSFVMSSAFNDLFKSEFFTKVRVIVQCLQVSPDTPPEVKDSLTCFFTNVGQFQSGSEGFINIIVDVLCNWKELKETLMIMGKAKLEQDEINKWKLYSQFFFHLVQTFCPKTK